MGSAVNIHANRLVSTQKGNNKGRPRAKRLTTFTLIFKRFQATIVRSDASSLPKEGCGLILHDLLDPREDVAPGKFTLSQSFVKLSQKKLSRFWAEASRRGA